MYPKHFESVGMSSPYPNTFTNAIYHTKLWTNIAGFVFPKEFCITNFYAQAGKYSVFEGIVTNISLIFHIKEFEIPLRTYVKEQRHSLVAPLKSFAYLTNMELCFLKQIKRKFANERNSLLSPRPFTLLFFLIFVGCLMPSSTSMRHSLTLNQNKTVLFVDWKNDYCCCCLYVIRSCNCCV